MAEDESYQLILEKAPEERQPETALFLSGCFSLPPAAARGIAASGPIVLLSDMAKGQAEAVLSELRATLPPGIELRVAGAAAAAKFSRLQWPRPPRIYGRGLEEFKIREDGREERCPLCGGALRLVREGDEIRLFPSGLGKRSVSVRRIVDASDKDPLFSGIKPLAGADADFASLRSLQAGDTGFWMDYGERVFAPLTRDGIAAAEEGTGTGHAPLASSSSHRGENGKATATGKSGVFRSRSSSGLAAFMKPGVFALMVGRTRDNMAVKMVADIMGVSEDEARDKCLSLGLCVVRDVALDEAQNLLARFKNLGVRARIVKPM